MRVPRMICHALAIAALGSVCMAQSSTGCASQDENQKAKTQKTENQRETGQPKGQNSDMPASMSRDHSGAALNDSGERVAKENNAAPPDCELDPRAQTREENAEKLSDAQPAKQ